MAPVVAIGSDASVCAIVGKHNSGALVKLGIGDDLANWKLASLVAAVATNMQALGLSIDVRDPETLAGCNLLRHAPGKEDPCGLETVKLQWGFGTLVPHQRCLDASIYSARILFDPIWPTIVETDHFHIRLGAAATPH